MPRGSADVVRPQLEAQLEDDETLQGIAAATYQKTMAAAPTQTAWRRRLLLLALDADARAEGRARVALGEPDARSWTALAAAGTTPSAVLDALR